MKNLPVTSAIESASNLSNSEPIKIHSIIGLNESINYEGKTLYIGTTHIFGKLVINASKIIFLPVSGSNTHYNIILEPEASFTLVHSSLDFSLNLENPTFSFSLKDESELIIDNIDFPEIGNTDSGFNFIEGKPNKLSIKDSSIKNTLGPI